MQCGGMAIEDPSTTLGGVAAACSLLRGCAGCCWLLLACINCFRPLTSPPPFCSSSISTTTTNSNTNTTGPAVAQPRDAVRDCMQRVG